MTTTTVFATIEFSSLTNVTGGCHKQGPQVINNNNNNVVQAPPAPAPAPQIIQAAPPPRNPVSVAVDYSYG